MSLLPKRSKRFWRWVIQSNSSSRKRSFSMDTVSEIFSVMSKMKKKLAVIIPVSIIILSLVGIIFAISCCEGIGVKPPDNCLGWFFLILPMFSLSHASELHDAVWWFNLLRLGIGAGTIAIFLVIVWECTQSFRHALYIRYLASKHVVILGIGEKGYELAQSLLLGKKTVVAVDADKENQNFLKLQEQGAFFFHQNMLAPKLFTKLGLERAAALYIVSGNDAVNLDVVGRLRDYMKSNQHQNRDLLKVFVQVNNDSVRKLFWSKSKSNTDDAPYSIQGAICTPFSVYNEAARFLLTQYSPDKVEHWNADEPYHLVIAGFGWLGQKIVLQAIQMGHFARHNSGGTALSDSLELAPKIRITVLDENADTHRERFFAQYPVLDPNRYNEEQFGGCTPIAHVEFVKQDILGLRELPEPLKKPITHVFVCLADEVIALEAGKLLHSKLCIAGQTVVALPGESHLAEQMKSVLHTQGVAIEEVLKECCRLSGNESYLGQNREEKAKKVFRFFKEQYSDEVKALLAHGKDSNTLIDEMWHAADEWEHRSNYGVIDHAPIKLRAAGVTPDMSKDEVKERINTRLQLLSRMEHDRWCVERFLESWICGPVRDNAKRIHPLLIPFDKLSVEEQAKDHVIVRFNAEL
ncbi:MAG: NAD-binding protein [Thermoguttaceae bacterium]